MPQATITIGRVRPADLFAIARMVRANMYGVDRQFTRAMDLPLARYLFYPALPLYFLLAGRGYKAVVDGEIAGCAFLDLRPRSGFIFNVNVNRPYRRQGVAGRLMAHVEEMARASGRSWTALQVDNGNEPAEALYHQLGYRAYHPDLLRWNGRDYAPAAVADGASVTPASGPAARAAYDLSAARERAEGDSWVRPVFSDYAEMVRPTGGRPWRCRVDGHPAGWAWVQPRDRQLLIRLALESRYWGDVAAVRLVDLLVEAHRPPAEQVDVYLGSAGHHQAAAPLFQAIGYRSYQLARLLMIKNLDG